MSALWWHELFLFYSSLIYNKLDMQNWKKKKHLCRAYQDAWEIHPSMHLKVVEWTVEEMTEWGKLWPTSHGRDCDSRGGSSWWGSKPAWFFWQRRYRVKVVSRVSPNPYILQLDGPILSLRKDYSDWGKGKERGVGRPREVRESMPSCPSRKARGPATDLWNTPLPI